MIHPNLTMLPFSSVTLREIPSTHQTVTRSSQLSITSVATNKSSKTQVHLTQESCWGLGGRGGDGLKQWLDNLQQKPIFLQTPDLIIQSDAAKLEVGELTVRVF